MGRLSNFHITVMLILLVASIFTDIAHDSG